MDSGKERRRLLGEEAFDADIATAYFDSKLALHLKSFMATINDKFMTRAYLLPRCSLH